MHENKCVYIIYYCANIIISAGVAQSVERVALISRHLKVAGSSPAFGYHLFCVSVLLLSTQSVSAVAIYFCSSLVATA